MTRRQALGEFYGLHQAQRAWRRRLWLSWFAGMLLAVMVIVGCADPPLRSYIVETEDGEVHRPVGHFAEVHRGVLCVQRFGSGSVACWPLATVKTWRPGEWRTGER
jgi:hypothetical protein